MTGLQSLNTLFSVMPEPLKCAFPACRARRGATRETVAVQCTEDEPRGRRPPVSSNDSINLAHDGLGMRKERASSLSFPHSVPLPGRPSHPWLAPSTIGLVVRYPRRSTIAPGLSNAFRSAPRSGVFFWGRPLILLAAAVRRAWGRPTNASSFPLPPRRDCFRQPMIWMVAAVPT